MPLPSNIEKQIKEDAQAYAQKNKWIGTLDEVSVSDLVEWDEMAYTKGATEYAIWKVGYDHAKHLFEKILNADWAVMSNEITIGHELINEIKSFLDTK